MNALKAATERKEAAAEIEKTKTNEIKARKYHVEKVSKKWKENEEGTKKRRGQQAIVNLHMACNIAMGGGMMMNGMGGNMPGIIDGMGTMGTMNNFLFCGNGYMPNSIQGGMQQSVSFGNFQAGFAARPPPYRGA